tara:strand:- start:34544 stop:35653 length:1110 start_codon:yes stop_codon:yes gene_type:complete
MYAGRMSGVSRNELESGLLNDDGAQWQVYADWLLEHGAPWAGTIAEACAGKPNNRVQAKAEEKLLGDLDNSSIAWRYGVIDRLTLAPENCEFETGEAPMADALRRILAHPAGRLVREISLGLPPRYPGDIDWNFDEIIEILTAGTWPRLQSIDMSSDADHMDQPSWRRIGDMRLLWKATPNLRSLIVQGSVGSDEDGPPLSLGAIAAPNLQKLVVQSSGLDKSVVHDIARSKLPKLEYLELWFGQEDYGNTCSLEDLAKLLVGSNLPKLKFLGLMNSEWEAELISLIANSELLPHLITLDLSMGIISREGVDRLIELRECFAHLGTLNIDDNFILDEDMQRLRESLPMVNGGEQGDIEEEGWRYVSCGE